MSGYVVDSLKEEVKRSRGDLTLVEYDDGNVIVFKTDAIRSVEPTNLGLGAVLVLDGIPDPYHLQVRTDRVLRAWHEALHAKTAYQAKIAFRTALLVGMHAAKAAQSEQSEIAEVAQKLIDELERKLEEDFR